MRTTLRILWVMTLTLSVGPAHAEDLETPPDTDPRVIHWLDKIEQQSDQVHSLAAGVRYDRIQGLLGDRQRRFGTLVYVKGPPAKFAVHIDRLLVDQRLEQEHRWYIFDGVWLVERYEDQQIFIKRRVTPPVDDSGESVSDVDAPVHRRDPLAFGEGPFPLPLNQGKAALLKRFVVTLAPDTDSDPAGSVHLHLVPLAGRRGELVEVDLWYDRETLLPVRVRTLDDSENETVVNLKETRINGEVDESTIDTTEPTARGWRVEVKPWEG